MELLRKKDFNMGDCNYSISLFKQNEGFVVRADVPKNMDFKKNVVFEQKNATQSPSNLPKVILEGLVAQYSIYFGVS